MPSAAQWYIFYPSEMAFSQRFLRRFYSVTAQPLNNSTLQKFQLRLQLCKTLCSCSVKPLPEPPSQLAFRRCSVAARETPSGALLLLLALMLPAQPPDIEDWLLRLFPVRNRCDSLRYYAHLFTLPPRRIALLAGLTFLLPVSVGFRTFSPLEWSGQPRRRTPGRGRARQSDGLAASG